MARRDPLTVPEPFQGNCLEIRPGQTLVCCSLPRGHDGQHQAHAGHDQHAPPVGDPWGVFLIMEDQWHD